MDPHVTQVLFLRRLSPAIMQYLREGLGSLPLEFHCAPEDDREALLAMLPEVEVLVGWRSDVELLQAAKKLKVFINPGTGIQQHVEAFRSLRGSRELTLVNGHGNSYAVAQHSVAMLLSLASKLIPHHEGMCINQGWVEGQRSVYLRRKRVGLLGYGEINRKVHRFLSGFDLSFAAYRRDWSQGPGSEIGDLKAFSSGELQDFFSDCDVVINSLPDTSFTQGMVGMKELQALGPEGLFVNVGRGNTVIQEDLYQALRDRVIAGAALDVWWASETHGEEENPRPYAFPFHELDNLILSPHRAADAGGNLDRWDEVIENLKRIQQGRMDLLNVVDLDLEY